MQKQQQTNWPNYDLEDYEDSESYRDRVASLELLKYQAIHPYTYDVLLDLHDDHDGKFYMLSDFENEMIVQTFLKESDDYYVDILLDLKTDILDFIEDSEGRTLNSKLMQKTLNQKPIQEMWDLISDWKESYQKEIKEKFRGTPRRHFK